MRNGNPESFFPTQQQRLLLQAALSQLPTAVQAWEQWKANVDIDQLDPGSHRLLPLLYRNLRTHEVRDPLLGRLKGIYRRTWYENQLLFHHIAMLLRQLHDVGIETMLLKGVSLVLLYYRDCGLRPMGDGDVLVRAQQAPAAIQVLEQLGWKPEEGAFRSAVFARHGWSFLSAAGQALDLHWHGLHDCCSSQADEEFWNGAAPIALNGVASRVLNPTDLLLHVCVHGVRWNYVPTIRWVADAMMILRSPEAKIDWERLLKHARTYRLILPLRETLQYLRDLFDAPVPTMVMNALQQSHVSSVERIEYNYKTHDHRRQWLGYLPILWFDYRRSELYSQASLKLFGFVRYLQYWWGVRFLWQTPFRGLSLAMRKFLLLLSRPQTSTFPSGGLAPSRIVQESRNSPI